MRDVTRRAIGRTVLGGSVLLWGLLAVTRPYAAQEAAATVWDGVYTAAQADRGAEVYRKDCASCHGDALTGIDEAPALTGTTFLSNWNGQSVGDLVDLTRKSMPKDNENTLTRQQYVDVTAHVLRANKFPAGQSDLPTSGLRLGQIRIDAFRP
jgi:mono/diheme cytochrome c family protein